MESLRSDDPFVSTPFRSDASSTPSPLDEADVLGRPILGPGQRPERDGSPRRGGLETAARALRRRLWPVLICVVLVPVAAFAWSATRPKEYQATAQLLLRNLNLDQKLFGASSFGGVTDPQREADTNLRLVSLPAVAARTAARVPGLTPAVVRDIVEVTAEGQSDLIGVTATDGDPRRAARIANTFAGEYIRFRRSADRSQVAGAVGLVQDDLAGLTPAQQQGPRGQQLAKQVQQLKVLTAVQTGNAELVQPATPPLVASKPTPKRDAIIGLLAGILLGLALAFLLERLDTRLKETEDVEDVFGLPVLTELPESRAVAGGRQSRIVSEGPEAEAFALLRASLRYFTVERDVRSVVVTSPAPQDGKTTVALNLAAAAARAGEDVLLIEADLRRPVLSRRLELPPTAGLSGALARGGDLRDGLIALELPAADGSEDSPTVLDVLAAGPIPPNPAQLLESAGMRSLLEEAERLWDLVVIDTPPTTAVPDTVPLMSWASGVLVVCRLGRTRRGAAAKVRHQLESMNARALGTVVNGSKTSLAYYEYRSETPSR